MAGHKKRDPFAATSLPDDLELIAAQSAKQLAFLLAQNARENHNAVLPQSRFPEWQRGNQQLAEEICRNHIEFSPADFPDRIAEHKANTSDGVGTSVSFGSGNRARIVVDCEASWAPKQWPASARIPVPVPASSMR